MEGLKDGLKVNMEVFKVDMDMMNVKLEALTKLLQERLPSGDKVIHENHDEEERNMNYDFSDFKVGFKTHHTPNINMRKLDGKDLVTWILQMEQFFYLHDFSHTQNVCIAPLYYNKISFSGINGLVLAN